MANVMLVLDDPTLWAANNNHSLFISTNLHGTFSVSRVLGLNADLENVVCSETLGNA